MSSSNFNPKKDPQTSLRTCPTPCHPPTKIWIICSFAFCLITSWITDLDLQVEVSLFASLMSTKRKFRYRRPRGGGGTPENSWWWCAARFSKSWPYFRPMQKCTFSRPSLDQIPKIHTPGFARTLKTLISPWMLNENSRPWKSLKIAVGTGKSLNFNANLIVKENCKGKGANTKTKTQDSCFALNAVLENCEMCPWKSLNFLFKKGYEPWYPFSDPAFRKKLCYHCLD